jgi:hypothetical protein
MSSFTASLALVCITWSLSGCDAGGESYSASSFLPTSSSGILIEDQLAAIIRLWQAVKFGAKCCLDQVLVLSISRNRGI